MLRIPDLEPFRKLKSSLPERDLLEPSAIFWKWLCRLQGEKIIATRLRTGFIHKPSENYVNLKTELRHKFSGFLHGYENIEAQAMSNLLMMRGTNWLSFWNQESTNIGWRVFRVFDQNI
ncbi:hypothetical protein DL769_002721 [Monosporascus sp. CRB-8-3]|nr:hypothetical protein DL769_002721 [Monosporascus sp. CRB-8-3]